jgi:hypothetical protein
MSDLKEDLTVYHHIVFLEIIPLLEFHTRNYGTLAWRLEMTTVLPLVSMSEYTYSLRDYHPTSQPPEPQLSENETDTCLIDVGDVVMFDHSIPPLRSPPITPDEYSFLDDGVQVQLLPSQTELFATPTPGSASLPAVGVAPAPLYAVISAPRVRKARLGLDARTVFDCSLKGRSSRFTRPSDLAHHWRNLH